MRRPQVSLQLAKKNAETRSYTARFSIFYKSERYSNAITLRSYELDVRSYCSPQRGKTL